MPSLTGSLLTDLAMLSALGVAAIVVVVGAATRPRRARLLLISVSILTSGVLLRGLTFLDEFLLACFLLGALAYFVMGFTSGTLRAATRMERLHWFVFLLMIAYMMFQSALSITDLESPRKLRWVVFYGMIGLVPIVIHTGRFPVPSWKQVAFTVTQVTLVYVAGYMLIGLTAEILYDTSRYALQTVWLGSTAYSLLPIAIAMPAIFISVKDRDKGRRMVGWTAFVLVLMAALYYDSRVSMLAIVAFLVVAMPAIGIKRYMGFVVSAIGILFVFVSVVWPSYRTLAFTVEDISGGIGTFWKPAEYANRGRIIDRSAYVQVTFSSISGNWKTFLFGHGLRTHGRIISPELRELYQRYGRPDLASKVKDDEGTEAFTALVVDTGVVGLLLLLTNLGLVALQVLGDRSNRYRYLLLMSIMMLFGWLFVINVLDSVLLYTAIMPSGLILMMARSREEKVMARPADTPAWAQGPMGAAQPLWKR